MDREEMLLLLIALSDGCESAETLRRKVRKEPAWVLGRELWARAAKSQVVQENETNVGLGRKSFDVDWRN